MAIRGVIRTTMSLFFSAIFPTFGVRWIGSQIVVLKFWTARPAPRKAVEAKPQGYRRGSAEALVSSPPEKRSRDLNFAAQRPYVKPNFAGFLTHLYD
jgi:hypothetical protein